jgi:hypothetical protein
MKFIIDITDATACFAKSVKTLCMAKKYAFKPFNKKYYLVDTDNKTCIGVDNKDSYETYTEAHGIFVIRKKL